MDMPGGSETIHDRSTLVPFEWSKGRTPGQGTRRVVDLPAEKQAVLPRQKHLLTWERGIASGRLACGLDDRQRRHREEQTMTQQAAGKDRGRPPRPTAGTFRARLEITNRSGWLTREYRLLLPHGRVRVAYAVGRVHYDVGFDEQRGEVVCTCPAFEADGHCKHRDAVLSLLEGLLQRLGRRVTGFEHESGREVA
jgi:hypothetical protein